MSTNGTCRWPCGMPRPGVLVIASFMLMSTFATGLLLGWAGFLLMFQGEGAFAFLCAPGELACSTSDLRMNLQFTVAYFIMSGTTLPSGILVDRCPPRLSVSLALLGTITSFVLISVATGLQGLWWNLLWPALLLMAFCSGIPLLAGFPMCALFPKWQGPLTGLMSGCYGISAIVPIALHSIWTAMGGTGNLVALAFGYAVLLAMLLLFALTLPMSRCHSDGMRCEFAWSRGFYLESAEGGDEQDGTDGIRPTLKSQILCRDFLAFSVYFCVHLHAVAFYLGSVNLYLQGIDMQQAGKYTAIFGWIAPFGVVGGPVGSAWITNRSRGPNRAIKEAGALVTALQFLMLIIAWSEILELQVIAFFGYTIGQELFFASMFSWLGARFGFTHFGTLVGSLMFFGGLLATTANPIIEAAATSSDGFRMAFLVLSGAGLASWLPLLYLKVDTHTEESQPKSEETSAAKAEQEG